MYLAPPTELTSLTSLWSFAWWAIDLLGPFPKAVGQLKYLVVTVDYSTKWIEGEPLAKNSAKYVLQFFKKKYLSKVRNPSTRSLRQRNSVHRSQVSRLPKKLKEKAKLHLRRTSSS